MNAPSRVCAACRRLNRGDETHCSHCGASLGGLSRAIRECFSAPRSATKFLIGLCLFDFAVLVAIQGSLPLGLFGPRASSAAIIGAGGVSGSLGDAQPWRLLSATFVHLSALHLVMNMYALLSFAQKFEESFGGPRLIVTYVVTGVFGFWLSGFWYGPYGPLTAGASGALFGLIGVQVGVLVHRRDPAAKEVFFQYLFLAVALAIVFPVNNWAHFGGFLAGFPMGIFLSREQRSPARDLVVSLASVGFAIVAVVSIALSLATLYYLQRVG